MPSKAGGKQLLGSIERDTKRLTEGEKKDGVQTWKSERTCNIMGAVLGDLSFGMLADRLAIHYGPFLSPINASCTPEDACGN